jgi:hypothetical protein
MIQIGSWVDFAFDARALSGDLKGGRIRGRQRRNQTAP